MAFATETLSPELRAPFATLLDLLTSESGALDRERREDVMAAAARSAEAAPAGSGLDARASALLRLGRRLSAEPHAFGSRDIEELRGAGLGDEEILEAILTAGCGVLLDVLAKSATQAAAAAPARDVTAAPESERRGPFLRTIDRTPADLPAFDRLQKAFGFVPKLYRSQTLRPDAIEAETRVLEGILFAETTLSRVQKESILVAAAAARRNTYAATLHGRVLQLNGIAAGAVDQVAADPARADLPEADRALLDAARRLLAAPCEPYGAEALRRLGWSDAQIREAATLAALAGFLCTVQAGLGVPPDFRPRRDFVAEPPEGLNLSAGAGRPKSDGRGVSVAAVDPDGSLVASARAGDLNAFEDLVRRHQGRVYRTLMGITGNAADAEDGAQSVFLKVFRKLADFGGESLFSTWLHRIAVNEGIERLRSRRPTESLDESAEDDFRPSRLQAWVEDPESAYARSEMNRIVEEALGRLPTSYRTVLLLRDIQQLSGPEAAAILGVPLPTLKTRLLRGRLMLREALVEYFAAPMKTARA